MKEEDIYKEYVKYNFNRPWFFGKEEHWKTYYEGYEMGWQKAQDESVSYFREKLGLNLYNFPAELEEQYEIMKKALQKYYEEKK